jgi:hypothetical protein
MDITAGTRTTVTAGRPSQRLSLRRAGGACVLGATVLAVSGVLTQVSAASTDVSPQAWSYPWSTQASMWISLVWGVAQSLLVAGVLGLRRSGAAGPTRAANVGLLLAMAGTALIVLGHLGSIPTAGQNLDDTGAQLVGAVFALGTVVSAVGLLLAGTAVARTRRWHGWRRFTTLAAGVWTLALLGLQLTAALPSAVAVYALCFAGIGAAVAGSPTPRTPPLTA